MTSVDRTGNIKATVAGAFLLSLGGCFGGLCDVGSVVEVRGRLIDAATGTGIRRAAVWVRLFTDGALTEETGPVFLDELSAGDSPVDGDEFTVLVGRLISSCPFEEHLGGGPLPYPDRIEFEVEIDDCIREFTIDVNEDSVVNLNDPNRVVELREPLLFSACGDE